MAGGFKSAGAIGFIRAREHSRRWLQPRVSRRRREGAPALACYNAGEI